MMLKDGVVACVTSPLISSVRPMVNTKAILRWAVYKGLSIEQCLEWTDFDLLDLTDSEKRIRTFLELSVVRNIIAALGDTEYTGVSTGLHCGLSHYDILSIAVRYCKTVRGAIFFSVENSNLAHALTRMSIEIYDDAAKFIIEDENLPDLTKPFIVERDAAIFLCTLRKLTSQKITFSEVGLKRSLPQNKELHLAELGVSPKFAQVKNYFYFDGACLDEKFVTHCSRRLDICREYYRALQREQLSNCMIRCRIKSQLLVNPRDHAGFETLVRDFNMSSRNLRRILQQEGTSFSKIIDSCKENSTTQLIISSQHSLEHISETLGYSALSSFSHSFRHWKRMNASEDSPEYLSMILFCTYHDGKFFLKLITWYTDHIFHKPPVQPNNTQTNSGAFPT